MDERSRWRMVGELCADNPYFNVTATHSYSVGNDFNHTSLKTKTYVKRVVETMD